MVALNKAYKGLIHTVNILSVALGIYGIFFVAVGNLQDDVKPAIWFIIILCSIFLVNNFILRRKLSKYNLNYSEGYQELNIGFAAVHELHNVMSNNQIEDEHKKEKILTGLRTLSTSLKNAFDKIKDKKCAVCIKILRDDTQVETICRDSSSRTVRVNRENEEKKHLVGDNTDFSEIMLSLNDPAKRYYLAKNLPSLKNYKNSRIDDPFKYYCMDDAPKWYDKLHKRLKRKFDWPLPYRSTLVVPILPLTSNGDDSPTPAGFLCVDSRRSNIFNDEHDLEIMKGVSDGLYYYLDNFKSLI